MDKEAFWSPKRYADFLAVKDYVPLSMFYLHYTVQSRTKGVVQVSLTNSRMLYFTVLHSPHWEPTLGQV